MAVPFILLGLAIGLSMGSCNSSASPDEGGNKTINLLALVPYAQAATVNQTRYGDAPAHLVVPAIRLAVKHINCREDVLDGYTLRVIEADSGCPLWLNSVVHLAQHVFSSGQNVAAVIGPACGKASQVVGSVAARGTRNGSTPGEPSLLQVGSSTSPALINEKFINTFRVTSSFGHVNAYMKLIRTRGWRKFAAIYDTSTFFVSVFQEFHSRVRSDPQADLVSSVALFNFLPLNEIRDIRDTHRLRVVFVFAPKELAGQVLCYAWHVDMVFDTMQWVFLGSTYDDLVRDVRVDRDYSCTMGQMQEAAEGVILSANSLQRNDTSTNDTVAGISFDNYMEQYRMEKAIFSEELNHSLDKLDVAEDTQFSNAFYDIVWAIALALNNSLPKLNQTGYDLTDYNYMQTEATEIIRHQLLLTKFQGMSGSVEFNETIRDNLAAAIDLLQIRCVPTPGSFVIGSYAQCPNCVFVEDGTALWIDSHEFELVYISWPDSQVYPLLLQTLLVLVITVSLHLANSFLAQHRSIKATSTNLNNVIFSGCYLFLFAAFLFIFFRSFFIRAIDRLSDMHFILFSVHCNMYLWCATIGYTLIFGTVCAKTWRIYRIFAHFRRPRDILICDKSLVAFVMSLMFVDLILLMILNFTDPWLLNRSDTFDGKTIEVAPTCQFSDVPEVLFILLVFKASESILVVMLAIMTRKVHKNEYKSTKALNALIYILFLFNGVIAILFVSLQNSRVGTQVLLFEVLIVFVVLCDLFLFVPPVWPVLMKKKNDLVIFVSSSQGQKEGPLHLPKKVPLR